MKKGVKRLNFKFNGKFWYWVVGIVIVLFVLSFVYSSYKESRGEEAVFPWSLMGGLFSSIGEAYGYGVEMACLEECELACLTEGGCKDYNGARGLCDFSCNGDGGVEDVDDSRGCLDGENTCKTDADCDDGNVCRTNCCIKKKMCCVCKYLEYSACDNLNKDLSSLGLPLDTIVEKRRECEKNAYCVWKNDECHSYMWELCAVDYKDSVYGSGEESLCDSFDIFPRFEDEPTEDSENRIKEILPDDCSDVNYHHIGHTQGCAELKGDVEACVKKISGGGTCTAVDIACRTFYQSEGVSEIKNYFSDLLNQPGCRGVEVEIEANLVMEYRENIYQCTTPINLKITSDKAVIDYVDCENLQNEPCHDRVNEIIPCEDGDGSGILRSAQCCLTVGRSDKGVLDEDYFAFRDMGPGRLRWSFGVNEGKECEEPSEDINTCEVKINLDESSVEEARERFLQCKEGFKQECGGKGEFFIFVDDGEVQEEYLDENIFRIRQWKDPFYCYDGKSYVLKEEYGGDFDEGEVVSHETQIIQENDKNFIEKVINEIIINPIKVMVDFFWEFFGWNDELEGVEGEDIEDFPDDFFGDGEDNEGYDPNVEDYLDGDDCDSMRDGCCWMGLSQSYEYVDLSAGDICESNDCIGDFDNSCDYGGCLEGETKCKTNADCDKRDVCEEGCCRGKTACVCKYQFPECEKINGLSLEELKNPSKMCDGCEYLYIKDINDITKNMACNNLKASSNKDRPMPLSAGQECCWNEEEGICNSRFKNACDRLEKEIYNPEDSEDKKCDIFLKIQGDDANPSEALANYDFRNVDYFWYGHSGLEGDDNTVGSLERYEKDIMTCVECISSDGCVQSEDYGCSNFANKKAVKEMVEKFKLLLIEKNSPAIVKVTANEVTSAMGCDGAVYRVSPRTIIITKEGYEDDYPKCSELGKPNEFDSSQLSCDTRHYGRLCDDGSGELIFKKCCTGFFGDVGVVDDVYLFGRDEVWLDESGLDSKGDCRWEEGGVEFCQSRTTSDFTEEADEEAEDCIKKAREECKKHDKYTFAVEPPLCYSDEGEYVVHIEYKCVY